MDVKERALQAHEKWGGKIEVVARCEVNSKDDLSIAYTPALPSRASRSRTIRLSAISTRAATIWLRSSRTVRRSSVWATSVRLPACRSWRAKCALFKAFADVDAFPLCVASKNVDEIVRTVQLISGSFGGINLEDIAAPALL